MKVYQKFLAVTLTVTLLGSCTTTPTEKPLIVKEDPEKGLANAKSIRENTAIQLADGLEINLWSKAGFAVANEMVLSGRLYGAEELFTRRLVDVVVDDGAGEAAIDRAVREVDPRLRGTLAALQAQRLAAPIRLETLQAIVDLWAEAAMKLTDRDLRLMERLARAQARKAGGAEEGAVEEIKRMELETAWGDRRIGADRRAGGQERRGSVGDRRAG